MTNITETETQKIQDVNLVDRNLTTILLSLEFSTKNMGFFYSKECAKLIYFNPVSRFQMNNMVFRVVASRYGTTSSKIERAIRHTLSVSSTQKCMHIFEKILNIPVNFNILHPSVCEFLCLLAESINFVNQQTSY